MRARWESEVNLAYRTKMVSGLKAIPLAPEPRRSFDDRYIAHIAIAAAFEHDISDTL